jgi:rhamnosyl/mannosyltransferase
MNVLHTVKYYKPSLGGMESVVENIVNGIQLIDESIEFTVYSNHHTPDRMQRQYNIEKPQIIKESTSYIFKSQPLSIFYPFFEKTVYDFDIIHHHFPFPNFEITLLRYLQVLKSKIFIVTWHANITNSRWAWISKFYFPLIKKILKSANHIVVTSQQLFDNSNILHEFENKVTVIPLSFNSFFEANNDLICKAYPRSRFKLLFVGKLRKYKGVIYLLEAIKNLDVDLTIVGSGEEEQILRHRVIELGIGHKVAFVLDSSNIELKKLYQNSDLFILPSINEAEAFGVVQLEAMANGLPVINTNLNSGVPTVSINGLTGITVQPENSQQIAEAIKTLMKDENLYLKFSKNSISRSKDFSNSSMAAKYLELYKSC